MLPKTAEPIPNKTTAQKIKELTEQGSMNHRTMIAKAKHTDFMNPYSMSCGIKTSAKNHTGDYHRCCMVAGAGKRNGNRARTMACQDKEQVPRRDKELKTWDLDKTKVRIQVDRTK